MSVLGEGFREADKSRFIGVVSLFKGLNAEQVAELARVAQERSFQVGDTIIKLGEPGDGLYLVISGMAKVVTGEGETVIASIQPGETFGELALLDGQPRSASVVASQPTECLFIGRMDFLIQMQHHPQIAFALLPVLAERIREADKLILQLSMRLSSPLSYRLRARNV